jgi:SNF2 family DNA or RNA helicase
MVAALGRRLVIDSSDEEEGVEFVSELIRGLNVEDDSGPLSSSSSDAERAERAERTDDGKNVNVRKKTLMPHQRTGVDWLLNLNKVPSGGILADDMGLGKTFQVASFVHTLLERGLAKRVLIVAPKTLLGAWENEVSKELEMDMTNYGGGRRATTKAERHAIMDRISRDGGILMMTYGLIQRDAENVRTHELHDEDDGPFWDVLVMDEGHTLKNTGNKTRAEIEKVDARMKLLITGTPIQNNLMELHSLFDLVKEGLLGDKTEFPRHGCDGESLVAEDVCAVHASADQGGGDGDGRWCRGFCFVAVILAEEGYCRLAAADGYTACVV